MAWGVEGIVTPYAEGQGQNSSHHTPWAGVLYTGKIRPSARRKKIKLPGNDADQYNKESFANQKAPGAEEEPMISGIHSALSGLLAIQKKTDSAANNVANVNSDGYKKTRVTLHEQDPQGVRTEVQQINTPGPMVYEQTPEGETLVEKSNVELSEELPNMMLGRRLFQANLKTVQTEAEMLGSLFDIKS